MNKRVEDITIGEIVKYCRKYGTKPLSKFYTCENCPIHKTKICSKAFSDLTKKDLDKEVVI